MSKFFLFLSILFLSSVAPAQCQFTVSDNANKAQVISSKGLWNCEIDAAEGGQIWYRCTSESGEQDWFFYEPETQTADIHPDREICYEFEYESASID